MKTFVKIDPYEVPQKSTGAPPKVPNPPKVDAETGEHGQTLGTLGTLGALQGAEWSAAEWRHLFDHRAAFLEFDCGADRATAERAALALCVGRWAWRNPPARMHLDELCSHCGLGTAPNDSVPAVFCDGGARRVHHGCVDDFRLSWIDRALAVLGRLGVPTEAAKVTP